MGVDAMEVGVLWPSSIRAIKGHKQYIFYIQLYSSFQLRTNCNSPSIWIFFSSCFSRPRVSQVKSAYLRVPSLSAPYNSLQDSGSAPFF